MSSSSTTQACLQNGPSGENGLERNRDEELLCSQGGTERHESLTLAENTDRWTSSTVVGSENVNAAGRTKQWCSQQLSESRGAKNNENSNDKCVEWSSMLFIFGCTFLLT